MGASVKGKSVIVTGAGTGIGRAIAMAFAAEGASVMLNGRRPEPLAAVLGEIEAARGSACVHAADVSSQASALALVDEAKSRFGRLDVLINNAGKTYDALILRMKWDAFEEALAVNLKSAFY